MVRPVLITMKLLAFSTKQQIVDILTCKHRIQMSFEKSCYCGYNNSTNFKQLLFFEYFEHLMANVHIFHKNVPRCREVQKSRVQMRDSGSRQPDYAKVCDFHYNFLSATELSVTK